MIGVSCTEFCSRPIEEWAGPISKDFRLWEIFSEADHQVVRDTTRILEILDENDLACQVHAPICDWNLAAMSTRLREASVKETIATIEAAEEIGARMVTVHPGLSSMAVGGLEERAAEHARAALMVIDRFVDGRDLTVAIENMPNVPFFLGRTAEQLKSLVDGTDLGICFDIGHANTMGQIDAMIDTFGDRIANIHIHDNNGKRDEHLTIGDGAIDFQHVIGRLSGYRGNWIIESKSLESAVQSSSRLEKMIS
ncbi:MAG: sugar phosphate isomerase/epimerase family protein [Thermoplasmata archaeon]|nr:sugar phosphate isomerase/epimerase family protein [Thermoplasmata archaeon]